MRGRGEDRGDENGRMGEERDEGKDGWKEREGRGRGGPDCVSLSHGRLREPER